MTYFTPRNRAGSLMTRTIVCDIGRPEVLEIVRPIVAEDVNLREAAFPRGCSRMAEDRDRHVLPLDRLGPQRHEQIRVERFGELLRELLGDKPVAKSCPPGSSKSRSLFTTIWLVSILGRDAEKMPKARPVTTKTDAASAATR